MRDTPGRTGLRAAKWIVALVALGVGALFVRYGSLAPCDWLPRDVAAKSGLPELLIRPIMDRALGRPLTQDECLDAWWKLHRDGLDGPSPFASSSSPLSRLLPPPNR